ncbi:MAG TPA: hypothetical protein VHK69_10635 [Chitinophagaceae bacterium]|nr:hypothetical protein [Chitinophagaceae bacterium]
MNKKIASYEELLEERQRLEDLLVTQKAVLKSNWVVLKDELRPAQHTVSNIFGVLSKMGTRRRMSPVTKFGVDFGIEFLLRRFILARAGWLARIVVPFIVKNYATHMLAEQKKPVWKRIKRIFERSHH